MNRQKVVTKMKFKIGFSAEQTESNNIMSAGGERKTQAEARRSVVQVYFSQRHMELAYYNDMFDLKIGDLVYVDGKLEGMLGRITDVNYTFKIRVSDYKRVISVVDTSINGTLYFAGSCFVAFGRDVLPKSRALSWFEAPEENDEEYAEGSDDKWFPLENLKALNLRPEIAERGYEYYNSGCVKYLCLDKTRGYALVEGRELYEVEFDYKNGEVGNIVCSCYCSYNCKHEFAVLLQLRSILNLVEKNYGDDFKRSGYLMAINKKTLLNFAVYGKEVGKISL